MAFKHIVYCTDFSTSAETAFSVALEMAEKNNAKIWILHVMPPAINPMAMNSDWEVADHPKEALVLHLQERMQQEYGDRVMMNLTYELVVLDGHISTEILNFINENNIDLCILGAFGMSSMGLVMFGSVAQRISQEAACSVMVIRSKDDQPGP